jgi:hypothetical protein
MASCAPALKEFTCNTILMFKDIHTSKADAALRRNIINVASK